MKCAPVEHSKGTGFHEAEIAESDKKLMATKGMVKKSIDNNGQKYTIICCGEFIERIQ